MKKKRVKLDSVSRDDLVEYHALAVAFVKDVENMLEYWDNEHAIKVNESLGKLSNHIAIDELMRRVDRKRY